MAKTLRDHVERVPGEATTTDPVATKSQRASTAGKASLGKAIDTGWCRPPALHSAEGEPKVRHDNGWLDDRKGGIDAARQRPSIDGLDLAIEGSAWAVDALLRVSQAMPDAEAFFRHWLGGSGEPRTVDYEKFVADDPSGATIVATAIEDIADLAAQRDDELREGRAPDLGKRTFVVRSEPFRTGARFGYPPPRTMNWLGALGAHALWLEGAVEVDTLRGSDGRLTRVFAIDLRVHVSDHFNFNRDEYLLPDSVFGRLEGSGAAKQFLVTGSLRRSIRREIPFARPGEGSGKLNPRSQCRDDGGGDGGF